MTEYALIFDGDIATIINTYKTVEQLAQSWPGYDISRLDCVPVTMLKRYRYWNERP